MFLRHKRQATTNEYRYGHYLLVILQGVERIHFSRHQELLLEMVSQVMSQDFHVVLPYLVLDPSRFNVGQGVRFFHLGIQITTPRTLTRASRWFVTTTRQQAERLKVRRQLHNLYAQRHLLEPSVQ